MRKAILFFVSVLLSYGIAYTIAFKPGYILIAWGSYSLESSLLAFVFLSLCGGIVGVLGLKLLRILSQGLNQLYPYSKKAKQERQIARINQAVISYMTGQWDEAGHLLTPYMNKKMPLSAYLVWAKSSLKKQDDEMILACLSARFIRQFEGEWAFEFVRAECLLYQKEYESAIILLKQMHQRASDDVQILKWMKEAYWALEAWSALKSLLPVFKRYSVFSIQDYDILQKDIIFHEFNAAYEKAENVLDRKYKLKIIKTVWNNLSDENKKMSFLLKQYAELLIKLDLLREAEHFIHKQLNLKYDAGLVSLYTQITKIEPFDLLNVLKKLLNQNKDESQLLYCLSKVCMRCRLWGEAEQYALQLLRWQPSPKAYILMSEVYSSQGLYEKSVRYFEKSVFILK